MKSLIYLALVGTLVGQAPDAAISDEGRECFQWFSTLGYQDVKDATFAEVWTGRWAQSGKGPPTAVTIQGFVSPKENGRFEVLGVNLAHRELTTCTKPGKPEERVGFEARSFTEHARHQLDLLQHPPKDKLRRSGAKIGPKTEAFFTAYVCWQRGENALAQSLFDEARKLAPMHSGDDAKEDSMRVSLEKELGHYAMWDAVLRCGGSALGVDEWGHAGKLESRTELIGNFERIVKLFPTSEHIERAKKVIEVLSRMVAEDKTHQAIPDEALSKLPVDRQVEELIFRLRDQNGHQWGQPGWCSVFDMRTDGGSPAHRLAKIGNEAVPQLIESLNDTRLSRSVGFHRDFRFSHTVLTIGDCAQQILNRIAGRSFYAPQSTSSYMSRDEEVAATQKVAREWWAQFKAKGERQLLVDAIAAGSTDASSLVPKLKAKYPDAVADAVLAGAAKADNDWLVQEFVDLVGDVKTEAALDYLIRQLDQGKTTPIRMAAARQLSIRDHPGVVEKVIELWRGVSKEGDWNSNSGFEPTLEFLSKSGQAIAIKALATQLEQRSPNQRFEIVDKLGQAFAMMRVGKSSRPITQSPAQVSATESAIALLAKELEDTDARVGTSGNAGDFIYSSPRICDFALWALHTIQPEVYEFSNKATRRKRDTERITASNVWRKANNKPLLPVPTVTLPVLKEGESLRITSITFKPASMTNEIVTKVAKLEGTPFTPQAVSALLIWFARNEVKGVCGLSIEATREDDLRGVTLNVTMPPGDYPPNKNRNWGTHHNVLLNDKSLGNSTSGSSGGHLEKDDAWQSFEDAVAEAIKSPPTLPFVINAGMRGQ